MYIYCLMMGDEFLQKRSSDKKQRLVTISGIYRVSSHLSNWKLLVLYLTRNASNFLMLIGITNSWQSIPDLQHQCNDACCQRRSSTCSCVPICTACATAKTPICGDLEHEIVRYNCYFCILQSMYEYQIP